MHRLGGHEPGLAFLIAKVTVLFLLAWLIVTALRDHSAALRHHAWAAGILSSLALPAFTLLLPAWHSAALGGAAALWHPTNTTGAEADSGSLPAMIVNAGAACRCSARYLALFFWSG